MKLIIDPEFKSLCRKLTEDEFSLLEKNIISDGCIDPILIWDKIIIDGHNRYDICTGKNIHFNTTSLSFETREDAKLWIINNQLGRRNLSDLDRVQLLEAKRPILEEQARKRELSGKKSVNINELDPVPNLAQGTDSGKVREQLAKEAGISHGKYDALRKINDRGSDELKQAVRERKISASKGAKIAELSREDQVEKIKNEDIESESKKLIHPSVILDKGREKAIQHAINAINELKKIPNAENSRPEALKMVKNWINQNQ